jgi:hypothetical protein
MRSRSAFRLALVVLALAAGVLVGPLPAQAAPANCQAPPGTSGIDQYCETVPAAGGDQGTRGGGGGGRGGGQSGRLGGSVSRQTAAALRHSGTVGQAILGLSTGSSSTQGSNSGAANARTGGSKGHGAAKGSQGNQSSAPAAQSDNPLQAIRSAVTSGTSAGPGFVWILVLLGAIMAGLGWLRYRRSTHDG